MFLKCHSEMPSPPRHGFSRAARRWYRTESLHPVPRLDPLAPRTRSGQFADRRRQSLETGVHYQDSDFHVGHSLRWIAGWSLGRLCLPLPQSRSWSQRWQLQKLWVLLPQFVRGHAFDGPERVHRRCDRPHLHQEVNVIGLNRQLLDTPPCSVHFAWINVRPWVATIPVKTGLRRSGHQRRW